MPTNNPNETPLTVAERKPYAAMPLSAMEPTRLKWVGHKYALENTIRYLRTELEKVNDQLEFLATEKRRLEAGELIEPPH